MVIKTAITEMFEIKYPIIQSGMQRVSTAELVSSVANAGALGFLSALTQPSPDALADEIARTREMTDKPFGVNLTLLPTLNPVPYEAYAQVIADSGVPVVETAGRSPGALMHIFEQAGVKVVHKCTSIKHAKKAEALGCAAVTIDGFEAAGHPGEDDVTSLVLLPRAVDQLSIPVIACGGFGDARGVLAAFALGAEAVAMGTRFMATQEAPIHPNVKRQLIAASELDTKLILRSFRNTARVYANSIAEDVARIEGKGNAVFDDIAPLVSGKRGAEVLTSGDLEAGIWWAGLSSGLVHDVPTVGDLIERLVSESTKILQQNLVSRFS